MSDVENGDWILKDGVLVPAVSTWGIGIPSLKSASVLGTDSNGKIIDNGGSGTPITGSIAATQIAYGSAANTIEGSSDLTFDGSTLYVNGNVVTAGTLKVGAYTLPDTDGTDGYVLTTDGSGTVSWAAVSGTGTVTSVGLTVPTGLSVSGSPVTSSGTLAVSFASGYSIPTTANQTNWSTAYTDRISSLTTTGTSGAATLSSNVLNIPNYTYTLPTASTTVLGGVKVDGTTITISDGVISSSGSMTYPDAGIAVSTGSAWGTSLTAPTGDIVGTSDTQTLTNKTMTSSTNTLFTLTTTGTSGAASYSDNTLNIPQYSGGGTGLTWNDSSSSVTAAVNNGYVADSTSLITVTLPATAAFGSVVRVTGKNTGGWKVAQPTGATIHFGNEDTTTGTSGYLSSNNEYDAVELVCTTANTDWVVVSSIGNITYA